ncbi:hypothetical protein DUNSADRAFT_394 [Dunaliella salina]|uniref:Uncharacterized protein n=1 Tax=Dunaliella salina TaxID=3046 RepID=A0ABQ7GYD5_DUNSA|nr:hypothetical protein DUNSADRAFT_394 [Dunaliella salina]|eukprot:KAF5839615.1 hypothetical protein DUNSADRAFT_394 [Dunaliella salina]
MLQTTPFQQSKWRTLSWGVYHSGFRSAAPHADSSTAPQRLQQPIQHHCHHILQHRKLDSVRWQQQAQQHRQARASPSPAYFPCLQQRLAYLMDSLISVAMNLSRVRLRLQAVKALEFLRAACSMLPLFLFTLLFMPAAAHAQISMSSGSMDATDAGEHSCRVSSNASSSSSRGSSSSSSSSSSRGSSSRGSRSSKTGVHLEPDFSNHAPLVSSERHESCHRSFEQQQQQQQHQQHQRQSWMTEGSLGMHSNCTSGISCSSSSGSDPGTLSSDLVQAALDMASTPSSPDTVPHIHHSSLALPSHHPSQTALSATASPVSPHPSQLTSDTNSRSTSPSSSYAPSATSAGVTSMSPSLRNSPTTTKANSPVASVSYNPIATAADAASASASALGGHDSSSISGATLNPDQGATPQVCARTFLCLNSKNSVSVCVCKEGGVCK